MNDYELQRLLDEMTLEEEVNQLLQLAPAFYEGANSAGQITGPLEGMGITEETVRQTGSVLGLGGAEEAIAIQEAHLKHNRLNIPLLTMADVIHGYRTIFPVPLALGCSWDLELAERSAAIAAKESAVAGIHVTFSPMADLTRDPRWGRVMESTGEDPWLNSQFARAFVRGYQGKDVSKEPYKIAACIKHFAAYGAAEGGRDYNTVDMSEWMRREYYMPSYRAALEEGCEMVMTAFNTVDGIPATANRKLMRDLLRGEWGFDGVLISDWGAVKEMIPHGVAEDEKECARKAIEAGVDIEMMSPCYPHHLQELVEGGDVDIRLLDEAVMRILKLKRKLGLFENPHRYADSAVEREVLLSAEHRAAAHEAALKSCVLLQNEGKTLPLAKGAKVALIGPFANSDDLLGPWSCMGKREEVVTLADGMRVVAGSSAVTAVGCGGAERLSDEELAAMLDAARSADVVVLALGEDSEMSGEAGCRSELTLPGSQLELVRQVRALGKPTVAVLFNGRPLDLRGVLTETDAVLEAWYPGTNGGAAVAELLYGIAAPSGRLTMSFPHSAGQIPVYYNAFNTGRPQDPNGERVRYVSQYLDVPNEPLLPFGYGLGYTDIRYGEASLSSGTLSADGKLTLTVAVTNSGDFAAEETVQLYVRDMAGETVRPLRELKGFEKVKLEAGETKTVAFQITEEMLRYHHSDLQYSSDPGRFLAMVGPNSRDVRELAFELR
ncbi:glycoside hydrolase family 3 N-terminal domain-containing protein [Paenibacillus sp. PAMC21692]|uniref:glycoside hydrolase family 3 N-terminal domain-containing protein n=1 Tax=Paenibacillus sp. PAMC21692 TaxID=2762320 RepID=UPI00164ECA26|nr:glycoside hydrolase family 3 N-terminal domain-containing protein [Paenibacillus sp. PAMC21692]QNK57563.1 glycoside hydrolase family 3 C-terminal domain-containing protein [Paenibacillus sp. PAMC21692]